MATMLTAHSSVQDKHLSSPSSSSLSPLDDLQLLSNPGSRGDHCVNENSSSSIGHTPSMEHVLKLNNKGIKLLQHQKYGKATAAFSASLGEVKQLLSATREDSASSSSITAQSIGFRFQQQAIDTIATATYTGSFFNSPIKVVVDDNLSSRRRRHRRHSSTNNSAAGEGEKTLVMASFALLYNLGICFQMGALQKQGENQQASFQKRLSKALTFYQTAQSLMTESAAAAATAASFHQNQRGQDSVSWDTMERIALWHNLGQVHCLLGHAEQAQACHEKVFGSLLSITHFASDPLQQRRSIFQFDFFFHHAVTHALGPTQSSAAA